MKVGIITSSLRMDTKSSLRKAAELKADGVQLNTVGGDLDPANLNQTGRQDILNFIRSLGIEISALCGDLGTGYTDPAKVDWAVNRTKEMVQLSVDLKTSIITTHIGLIPENESAVEWKTMESALRELGPYAEKYGTCLATETGPEEPKLMTKMLRKVGSAGIKINYDPANLIMMAFDHIAGVYELKDYIVHTHAKDAVRHPDGRPQEVPLGQGKVDFTRYLTTLSEVGFNGYLTVEREVGENPVKDIQEAIQFLHQFPQVNNK